MTTVYKFKAYYTDAGVGTVQDPAPTCTVINMADDSKLADAQATTASTNMPGLYSYEYSGNDGLDCVAWFKTTDTGCDVKELASYVSEKITTNLNADVAGVETKVDTIDANVDSILADTGTDGVLVSSGTGAKQISLDAGKVLLQATQTGVTIPTVTTLTNLPAVTTDWLTAAGVKADAVTKIQTGLATPTNITAGTITNATNVTNGVTLADNAITAAKIDATAGAEIADAVLDEVVIGSYTLRQLVKALAAKMVGKATGGGTTTITYRGVDDASNVIVETVDSSGNRSAVTLTV